MLSQCSGAMVEDMVEADLDVTIFFYNPNIHPKEEYPKKIIEIQPNQVMYHSLMKMHN